MISFWEIQLWKSSSFYFPSFIVQISDFSFGAFLEAGQFHKDLCMYTDFICCLGNRWHFYVLATKII